MILGNLTDRGTLRGALSVGSESGGTDNYNDLINKPSINSHELVGDQSGDDLDLIDKGSVIINNVTVEGNHTGDYYKLINENDLTFNVGHAGNILHNIKYKDSTYTTYAEPFRGATSDSNGTMGLVRAPLASQGDYNKFLKGNGMWASVHSGIDYSLNEQNTGIKWIDGKTIYQKTFIFEDGEYRLQRNNWTAIPSVSIPTIENLIYVLMIGYDTANKYPAIEDGCSKRFINGVLNYYLDKDYPIYIRAINVQYTKST